MKHLKKVNELVDIIANIKTDNVEDVEEFFNDVKKSYKKIISYDDYDNDDKPNNKTGRSYDEDNKEEEELIVQDVDETQNKKLDHKLINESDDFSIITKAFTSLQNQFDKLSSKVKHLETIIDILVTH